MYVSDGRSKLSQRLPSARAQSGQTSDIRVMASALLSPHLLETILALPLRALHLPTWPFIALPHAFNTCASIRPLARREFWLLNLAMTLLACVGGSLVFAVLTHTHPFFFSKTSALPLMVFVWWLMNWSPYDAVWRIYNLLPVRTLLQVVAALNRCRSVGLGFDKGRELFHGSPAGIFSIAIIAGLSGGLVTVWVKKLLRRSEDPEQHTEFSKPSSVIGAVLLGTTWLYVIEELHLLPITGQEARALFLVFMVAHALLEPTLGTGFVPFPLSHLLHFSLVALGIPPAVIEPAHIPFKKEKNT